MQEIEIKTDFKIGDKLVTSITVKPLTFKGLVDVWSSVDGAAKPQKAVQRRRMIKQVEYKAGSELLSLTDDDIYQMPRILAKDIIEALDHDQGKVGKVVVKGDGCVSPVVYQLGTPIKMKSKESGGIEIKEIEFLAETFGQVEDVMAAANDLDQAYQLLATIAAPVGAEGLTRLPGYVLDRITVGDGVGVMRQVLPDF